MTTRRKRRRGSQRRLPIVEVLAMIRSYLCQCRERLLQRLGASVRSVPLGPALFHLEGGDPAWRR